MPPIARPLLALILLGCSSEPTPPAPPPPPPHEVPPEAPADPDEEAAPVAPAAPPMAAFLVYGPESTTLVPLDPAGAPRTAPGHFVASVEAPREVVHRVVPASGPAIGIPACACGTIEGACLGSAVQRTIHVGDRVRVDDSGCPCWSTPESTAWPRRPRYPVDQNGESMGPCDEVRGPDPVVSVVGGRLYTAAWGSSIDDPCARDAESLNVYDAWGEELPLVGGAMAPLPSEGPRRCEGGEERPRGGPVCAPRRRDDGDEETGDPCDPYRIDFAYGALEDGRFCRIERGADPMGENVTCETCVEVSPARCPSALDPCGDPAPFRDAFARGASWWVATDGRAALVVAAREARLLVASAPPRTLALERRAIVGVLFHPDAGGILAAMTHDGSIADASPPRACRDDGACRDGRVCTNGACHPRCSRDADCDRSGQCGARCRDSRCGPVPDGRCGDDAPCVGGFVCANGACVDPEAEADEGAECPHDRACASYEACESGRCALLVCDPGQEPRAAAEACSRARRAGDALAVRSCRCALQAAVDDRVRGAIEYELGRIEEDAGDAAAAQDHYERSLVLRPNDVVRARLDGLSR